MFQRFIGFLVCQLFFSYVFAMVPQEPNSFVGTGSYNLSYKMNARILVDNIMGYLDMGESSHQEYLSAFKELSKLKEEDPLFETRLSEVLNKLANENLDSTLFNVSYELWQVKSFLTGQLSNGNSPLSDFASQKFTSVKVKGTSRDESGKLFFHVDFAMELPVVSKKPKEALRNPQIYLPNSDVTLEDVRNYEGCFPKFNLAQAVYAAHAFAYFSPQSCDFERLNAKYGRFTKVPFELSDFKMPNRQASPEYSCIFDEKDKTLKTLVVLGAYNKGQLGKTQSVGVGGLDSQRPADQAERTFAYLNRWVGRQSGYEKVAENLWGQDTPFDRSVRVKDPKTGKTLEARFVLMDDPKMPEDKSSDKWLSDVDLFVYAGHAGYGAKVREFLSSEEFEDDPKYRLIYLNGCNTFSYTQKETPHHDYIVNRRTSWFENAVIDVPKVISSVMAEKNYADIMNGMAFKSQPVAVGEESPSGLNCSPYQTQQRGDEAGGYGSDL